MIIYHFINLIFNIYIYVIHTPQISVAYSKLFSLIPYSNYPYLLITTTTI